ncbi:glutathione S-transferase-like [Olea europaea subsp. europaea]|uniref:glutathione transferase n=1 Tax=Olea europaea subsp. europaea TaxID=158383 RepID=A0A8S0V5F1_OLEEU|nr:glutathione S-transferase-like [Olea europaea subsp. europaea]
MVENETQKQTEQERSKPINLSILPMASTVKVYGPPNSAAVSRVLACLLEKDVQFQLIPINLVRGEQKKPDYLKLQPFGQVPVFQDESITLFESRAICRYICDKYTNQGNKRLFGTNPLEKASIDQWLEVEGQNFNPPTSVLVFQLAFVPRMKIQQDENLIKQNEEKLGKVLDVYENRLGESRYLAGDEFTLADLSHLPMSRYLVNACGRGELFTSRKNVGRWWDEISTRETWKKVNEMQNSPPRQNA